MSVYCARLNKNAIIGGVQNNPLKCGDNVEWVPGQMATVENRAIFTRISADTDRRQGIYYQSYWNAQKGYESPAGADYDAPGNYERMVIMPIPFWNPPLDMDHPDYHINSGVDHGKLLGFAQFFMLNYPCFDYASPMQQTSNPSVPCCAEYVGPASVINGGDDVDNPGVFKIQLVK